MRKLLILAFFVPIFTFAQSSEKKAKKYLANSNFMQAAEAYQRLVDKSPDNFHYLTVLGDCMVEMNKPSKAVHYYEKALALVKDDISERKLMMAYMKNGEFIKAMSIADQKIQNNQTANNSELKKVISSCKVGQTLTAHPLHLNLRHIGNDLNSKEDDILPFMSFDNSTVIFSSNRNNIKGKPLKSGKKPFEVFSAERLGDSFTSVNTISTPVNSKNNDFIVGMSGDREFLFVLNGNSFLNGNMNTFLNENGSYITSTESFNNLKGYKNIQGVTVSSDHQEMYFASDHSSGYGGTDIYISRKLPNGDWSEPENLGEEINTTKNESYPQLAQYDVYLYFSSDGHPGMGGKDLFKTKKSDEGWKKPQNLGFPLSTPLNDLNIAVNEKGNQGFISTVGDDSYGGFDIYEFEFKEITIKHAVMLIYLSTPEGSEILDAPLVIKDKLDNQIGIYYANNNTKRYTLALKPGEYSIALASNEYENYSEKIVVSPNNLNKFNNEIHLTVSQ